MCPGVSDLCSVVSNTISEFDAILESSDIYHIWCEYCLFDTFLTM